MAKSYIKSATLTFGTNTSELASAPTGKSQTREALEVTSLSDSVKRYIPGALTENDEFTLTLFQQSTGDIAVGATGTLSISVTLNDGTTDSSVIVSWNNVIVTKVEYKNQEGDGDRKATYDVTFRPDGSAASNSPSVP